MSMINGIPLSATDGDGLSGIAEHLRDEGITFPRLHERGSIEAAGIRHNRSALNQVSTFT